jgi:hypothetical protein
MFSEQDVDRELKAALSVSPSPEFEARVFQRVEADRPSHWSSQYRWFAAAACLVIVAGVFYALNRTSTVVARPPTPQIVEHTAPRALASRPEAPAHRNTSVPARVETERASRRSTRVAAPDVIVPLNQMEAVRRLVRAVNEGRIEPPAEPLQGPLAPPAALGVAPLVVEPIPLSPLGPGGETATAFIRGVK